MRKSSSTNRVLRSAWTEVSRGDCNSPYRNLFRCRRKGNGNDATRYRQNHAAQHHEAVQ
jgi:hypothetical protein